MISGKSSLPVGNMFQLNASFELDKGKGAQAASLRIQLPEGIEPVGNSATVDGFPFTYAYDIESRILTFGMAGRDRAVAVSYTHLDVYKRQEQTMNTARGLPGELMLLFTFLVLVFFMVILLSNPHNKTNLWCFAAGMLFSVGVLKEYLYYTLGPTLIEAGYCTAESSEGLYSCLLYTSTFFALCKDYNDVVGDQPYFQEGFAPLPKGGVDYDAEDTYSLWMDQRSYSDANCRITAYGLSLIHI